LEIRQIVVRVNMSGSRSSNSREKRQRTSRRSDKDERVQVHARVRPLLEREKEAAANSPPVYQALTGTTCNFIKNPGEVKSLTFDTVFEETAAQSLVYEKVAKNIIDGVLSGYNGTLFAYGQTGTGKTHTMMGEDVHADSRGIIPRALDHIFEAVEENSDKFTYELNMSYVQLYCELLQDLLEPDFSKTLTIREDTEQGRGVFIQGLSSFSVASKEECLNLLRIGQENRTVAETNMNAQSSRSHAAFMLSIERRPKASFDVLAQQSEIGGAVKQSAPKKTFAKLFIVDLAGSERVKTAGSMHGQRFSELKSINLSLSALGNCISALAEKKRHIPFRDSKLTRLLQDSLGGNARTSLVINVNPCPADAHETHSSLMFGQRAMAVQTRAKRNVEIDYKALYATVQSALDEKDDEIHRLQIELSKSKQMVDRLLQDVASARSAQQSAEMRASAINAVQTSLAEMSIGGGKGSGAGDSTGGGVFGLTSFDDGSDDNAKHMLDEINQKWSSQVQQLQEAFEKKLEEEKKRAGGMVTKSKEKTAKAEDMWNTIEYDLRGEREEHLRTCLQLKECRIQLNELDKQSSQRLSELTTEITELKEDLEVAQAGGKQQEELAQALKDSTKSVAAVRTGYRQKAQDLEKVYGEKIEWLVKRVEQLETQRPESNGSRAGAAPPAPHARQSRRGLPVGGKSSSSNASRRRGNVGRSKSGMGMYNTRDYGAKSRVMQERSRNANMGAAGGGGAGAAKMLRSSRGGYGTDAQKRRETKFALKSRTKKYGGGSRSKSNSRSYGQGGSSGGGSMSILSGGSRFR
jgi:kinesin family protein 5